MNQKTGHICLPDKRRLGYARFGDPTGRPVLFMHGFPSSRLEAELYHEPAKTAGLSLLAVDRPGFGLSDYQPDRTVAQWSADVSAVADALGLDRISVLGASGGCPFALACASRLQDRIDSLALVGGLGPTNYGPGVRRMGAAARLAFTLARRTPFIFRVAYGALAWIVARYPALNFRLNEATPPDQETLMQPEVQAIFKAAIGEAFRQGVCGAVQELLSAPWEFEVAGISKPVQIWHGLEDAVVPYEMGELLAIKLPHARLHLVPHEGHVSLPARHGRQILETLISAAE